MLAPRYGRGSSAVVFPARSSASLIATLTGSSDMLARLRLSTGKLRSKADLVAEFVRRHQRPACRRIGLARDHAGARAPGDAPFAHVARDHRLADQLHCCE